jgi:hypothetical protein
MMNVKLNNITVEYVTNANVSFHIILYIDLVHNDGVFVSMHMHMCMQYTHMGINTGWVNSEINSKLRVIQMLKLLYSALILYPRILCMHPGLPM